jgi:AcrR family transcriptional regulator
MPDDLSLRARKKLRTRELLVETAARLFAEKGFDAVTVADVARAAEISGQTIYNYFSTKETLVFDEEDAFTTYFTAMVSDLLPGETLIDRVRAAALAFLQSLIARPPSPHRKGGMPYLVATNSAVRSHWLAVSDRHARAVARQLVLESGGTLSTVAAKIMANSLLAVFGVIVDEMGSALKDDGDPKTLLKRLRREVDEALTRLAGGLAMPTRKPRHGRKQT